MGKSTDAFKLPLEGIADVSFEDLLLLSAHPQVERGIAITNGAPTHMQKMYEQREILQRSYLSRNTESKDYYRQCISNEELGLLLEALGQESIIPHYFEIFSNDTHLSLRTKQVTRPQISCYCPKTTLPDKHSRPVTINGMDFRCVLDVPSGPADRRSQRSYIHRVNNDGEIFSSVDTYTNTYYDVVAHSNNLFLRKVAYSTDGSVKIITVKNLRTMATFKMIPNSNSFNVRQHGSSPLKCPIIDPID